MEERKLYTLEEQKWRTLLKENELNYFITFRYMLPFRLPVEEKQVVKLKNMLFIPHHKEYEHYALKDGIGALPLKRTLIEGTVRVNRQQKRNIERQQKKTHGGTREVSLVFNEQLEILNNFIDLIIIREQFLNIYRVYSSQLLGSTIYKLYEYKGEHLETTVAYGMVNLHTYDKIAYDAYRDLNNDQFNVITDYFDEHLTNPYKDIALISRTGERFFYLHDYNSAIIYYNTVFEVIIISFVKNYYTLLGLKSPEKIKNIIENCGLKNIIKDHFNKRLDDLKLTDAELIKKMIDSYLKSGYVYRNDIVHSGASYGKKEAEETMLKIKDLVFMLTHNIYEAESNLFTEEYIKFNINRQPDMYEDIKKNYK